MIGVSQEPRSWLWFLHRPYVKRQLQSREPARVRRAVQLLGEHKDRSSVKALVDVLKYCTYPDRASLEGCVAEALAKIGDIAALIAVLDSPLAGYERDKIAIEALKRIGNAQVVEALTQKLGVHGFELYGSKHTKLMEALGDIAKQAVQRQDMRVLELLARAMEHSYDPSWRKIENALKSMGDAALAARAADARKHWQEHSERREKLRIEEEQARLEAKIRQARRHLREMLQLYASKHPADAGSFADALAATGITGVDLFSDVRCSTCRCDTRVLAS